MSLAAKAARDICLSSQPVFFANIPQDHLVHLISKTFINLVKQENSFQRSVFLEQNRK
jgi:hypothetical protein